jgi:hypothetical protein
MFDIPNSQNYLVSMYPSFHLSQSLQVFYSIRPLYFRIIFRHQMPAASNKRFNSCRTILLIEKRFPIRTLGIRNENVTKLAAYIFCETVLRWTTLLRTVNSPCHFVYPEPILNDTEIRNIGSGESVLSASVYDSRVRNNPRKIATYKTADDFIEITMSVLNCTEF